MARRTSMPVLTFKASAMRVRVPASAANLGPAFDCAGLALDWYDDLVAQVSDEPGIEVDMVGEGAEDLPRDGKHLVAKSMMMAFERMGEKPAGLSILTNNTIPHARGMGSSSAAIVGGIVLARALVVGGDNLLPDAAVLSLASEIEGHPDNVAAALYGGFTLAWGMGAEAHAVRLDIDRSIFPIVCIPAAAVATKKARGLLPETVSHTDAAFNAGRSALLTAAMCENPDLLMIATEDKLHQEQRSSAMKSSWALVQKLREAGHAAVISGAGSTVLVLATSNVSYDIAQIAGEKFETHAVGVGKQGAHVVPMNS